VQVIQVRLDVQASRHQLFGYVAEFVRAPFQHLINMIFCPTVPADQVLQVDGACVLDLILSHSVLITLSYNVGLVIVG
jgi:hypothetical protein